MPDARGYFNGGPVMPLHATNDRAIADSSLRILLRGSRQERDYTPKEGVYTRSPSPADTDNFVRELVAYYNQRDMLVELLRTVLREVSPLSSAAFQPQDAQRIYAHVLQALQAANIDPEVGGPATPAVLHIPPMPDALALAPQEDDIWQAAWLAGYKAAWPLQAAPPIEPKGDDT